AGVPGARRAEAGGAGQGAPGQRRRALRLLAVPGRGAGGGGGAASAGPSRRWAAGGGGGGGDAAVLVGPVQLARGLVRGRAALRGDGGPLPRLGAGALVAAAVGSAAAGARGDGRRGCRVGRAVRAVRRAFSSLSAPA